MQETLIGVDFCGVFLRCETCKFSTFQQNDKWMVLTFLLLRWNQRMNSTNITCFS